MAIADPTTGLMQTEGLDQDFLDSAAQQDSLRRADYALCEAYYTGYLLGAGRNRRIPMITDRVRRYIERSGRPFCENFCETVIDTIAERLRIRSFTAQGSEDKGQLSDLEDWILKTWNDNKMDHSQSIVHTHMLYKGDAYVIVDWSEDKSMPLFCFNRPETIPHCVYDDDEPDVIQWASKVWNSKRVDVLNNPTGKTIQRLNLYYPDRIERYWRVATVDYWKVGQTGETSNGGGWQRYELTDLAWPQPWVDKTGKPRGVPVFHFRHKALGYEYGRSELNSVIPFQDELNKQVIDLMEILDYLGWPQRWVKGVDAAAVNLKPQPGTLMHADSKDADFGQFAPAEPRGPLEAIEGTLSRLARRSRLPMHLLTGGTPPSGEALKTAESGLVSKVEQIMVYTGDTWEQMLEYAARLAQDLGAGVAVPDDVDVDAQWADPHTRNVLGEAQAAEIYDALGVSKHTIFGGLGMSFEEEMEWHKKELESYQEAGLDQGLGLPPFAMKPLVRGLQTTPFEDKGAGPVLVPPTGGSPNGGTTT